MTAAYGLGMFSYNMVCLAIGLTIIYFVIKKFKMMSDKDIEEYHNIGRSYQDRVKSIPMSMHTRIEDHGTRLYDVNGSRLPSVTTILGKTKKSTIHKRLEGESRLKQKQSESKTYLVIGGQLCTNSWSTIYSELATTILQHSDKRRKPWPKKLLTWVSHLWKSGMVPKLRYIIRVYTQVQQILFVYTMVLKLLLTSSKLTVRKRKNGSKIIICKSQHTPWPMTTSTTLCIEQGVIMVCTPDLYYQEFVVSGVELRQYKHKFLKRLDMYHDLIFDEKEKANVNINPEDFFNGA